MKLKLTNFLCYEHFELDLGDEGISLLSGDSGSGKTSILKAIFFALFGDGNKVQTYGKTSCKVELYFDDIKVVRTKRPNRLLVNDIYEDDSGQEFINKKFGNTFKTSGYIQQNNLNSFMLMSPTDKLDFLEKFAFKEVDIITIKNKTKNYIRTINDELISINSQFKTTKTILEEMSIPKITKFPINCKKSSIPKIINNQKIKFSNFLLLRKRAEKYIKNTEKELNSVKILEVSLTSKLENIDDISSKIYEIKENLKEIDYIGDESLNILNQDLLNCLKHKELIDLRYQMTNNDKLILDMKENEILSLNNELDKINNTIWSEYSKDETNTLIEDLKNCLINMKKLNKLEKELNTINISESTISLKRDKIAELTDLLKSKKNMSIYQSTYSCPCCNSSLKLDKNKLEIFNIDNFKHELNTDEISLEKLREDIITISNEILKLNRSLVIDETNLEKSFSIKKEMVDIKKLYEDGINNDETELDLEYLKEYRHSQLLFEKRNKEITFNIENDFFSSSYNSFVNSNQELLVTIQNLEINSAIPECNEEILRTQIQEQTMLEHKLKNFNKDLEKLENKKILINDSICALKDNHEIIYNKIKSENLITDLLNKKEFELNNLQKDIRNQEKILSDINKWDENQNEINYYDNFKEKVRILEEDEKITRSKYAAAIKLRDNILEAESLAMINIIDSINQHASIYLESFFTDHPISVSLLAFKEAKDIIKPKINVSVFYKGMDTDLTPLSGGELSRVILAFTLALAEMFNTPLLMLDECTSNLNQELSNVIFETIRENFNGKQTIVVAHQVVEGCFDKVVKM